MADLDKELVWQQLRDLPDGQQATILRIVFGGMEWNQEFLRKVVTAIEHTK